MSAIYYLAIGTKFYPLTSPDDAPAAFAKHYRNRVLSARTFKPAPVVESVGFTVVGFVSQNGRYWTREEAHGTTADKTDFGLMAQRYWNSQVATLKAAIRLGEASAVGVDWKLFETIASIYSTRHETVRVANKEKSIVGLLAAGLIRETQPRGDYFIAETWHHIRYVIPTGEGA